MQDRITVLYGIPESRAERRPWGEEGWRVGGLAGRCLACREAQRLAGHPHAIFLFSQPEPTIGSLGQERAQLHPGLATCVTIC